MQQWEYKGVELTDLAPASRQLKELGDEGWEFVYGQMMQKQGTVMTQEGKPPAPVTIIFSLFKRPKAACCKRESSTGLFS